MDRHRELEREREREIEREREREKERDGGSGELDKRTHRLRETEGEERKGAEDRNSYIRYSH